MRRAEAQQHNRKICETCGMSRIMQHECPPPIGLLFWTEITKPTATHFRVASVRCPRCRVASECEVDAYAVVSFRCDDCRHASLYRLAQWRRVNRPALTRASPPVTESDTRGT